MSRLYTSGNWLVKEGRESHFVSAWQDLAEWTAANIPGAGSATLLRDLDEPRRYLSFGPWQDMESIQEWRGSDGFQERLGRIRQLLDEAHPRTLEVAAEVTPG